MSDVRFNLRPLLSIKNMFVLFSPARRIIFKQWAFIYRTFARRRFNIYSRGGGDWPPLAASTIKRRRTGKRVRKIGRRISLLRDTGTLYAALSPRFRSSPGALEKMLDDGIEVGFGGTHKHPGGKATIADIASFHNEGTRIIPERKIIDDPDQPSLDKMRDVVIHQARKVSS